MKKSLLLLVIFLVTTPIIYGEHGSLLVLKNSYFYVSRSQKGKRILTRKRQAYDVVSIYNGDNSQMFRVLVYSNDNTVNESGYVFETDLELRALGPDKIKVFTEVPTTKTDLTQFRLVPSNQLSFTGRKETSDDFPHLIWRAVNYKTSVPEAFWIAAWSGIYRPDKSARWLNHTYQEVVTKQLEPNLTQKILLGLVETGYTKEQVKLALGEPIKEQSTPENSQFEWIYSDRKVIFKNDKVLQVL